MSNGIPDDSPCHWKLKGIDSQRGPVASAILAREETVKEGEGGREGGEGREIATFPTVLIPLLARAPLAGLWQSINVRKIIPIPLMLLTACAPPLRPWWSISVKRARHTSGGSMVGVYQLTYAASTRRTSLPPIEVGGLGGGGEGGGMGMGGWLLLLLLWVGCSTPQQHAGVHVSQGRICSDSCRSDRSCRSNLLSDPVIIMILFLFALFHVKHAQLR